MSVDLNSKCRTCLSDSNTYHQLIDYVEEKYKILDMLDGVVPQINIKTSTQFSTLVCQSCVDKLLNCYKFQQLCIETNNRLHYLLGIAQFEMEAEQKLMSMTGESGFKVKQEIEDACSEYAFPSDELGGGMRSDNNNSWTPDVGNGSDSDSSNEQLSVLRERLSKEIPLKIEYIENFNRLKQGVSVHEKKLAFSCEICKTNLTSEKSLEAHMLTHTNDEIAIKKIEQQIDSIGNNEYNEIFEIREFVEVYKVNDSNDEEECNELSECKKLKPSMHDNDGENSTDKIQETTAVVAEEVPKIIVKEEIEMTSQISEESMDELDNDSEWINDDYEESDDNSEKELFPKPGDDFVDTDIDEVEKPTSSNKKRANYPCETCGKVFSHPFSLKRHSSVIHSVTSEVEKPKNNIKKRNGNFPCEQCGKVFCYLYLLKRHSSAHSPIKPFECEICKYRFHTANILKAHLSQHKSEKRINNYQSRPEGFSCPDCPRRFEKLASLSMHRLVHTRSNLKANYSCMVCQCNFVSQRSLTHHVTTKHPEVKHKCDHCDKTFDSYSIIVAHLNCHKEKGKPICSICGKKFARHYNLIEHMRSHSGERPYHCTQCDKAFRHSTSLKGHMRIHSGENPYQCIQCSKKFSNSSNLRQHIERHTDLKKYQCSECPSRFNCRSDLIGHGRVHLKTASLKRVNYNNNKSKQPESGMKDVEEVNSLDKRCTNESIENIFIVKEEIEIFEESMNEADRFNNHKESDDNSEFASKLVDTGIDEVENSNEQLQSLRGILDKEPALKIENIDEGLNWFYQHTGSSVQEKKQENEEVNSNDKYDNKSNEAIAKVPKEENEIYEESTDDLDEVQEPKTMKRNGYYPCETCGKVFDSAYRLKRHSLVHSLNRPHECKICKYRFDAANLLKAHLTSHKNEEDRHFNSHPECFQCPDCPKSFKKKASLAAHRHIHTHNTSEANYSCMVCQRNFISEKSLTEHVAIKHPAVEKHKCDHCDKTFVLHAHLLKHLNRHNCNKNLVCIICRQEFRHISRLREHMRRHSPYACTLCDKTFRFSNSYRQHMNRHTGLRKYPSVWSLKNRKENDKYPCKTCGKAFNNFSELKRHVSSVHSLMRPHKCKVCKYRFVTASILKAHLSQHEYETGRNSISLHEGDTRPIRRRRFKKQASLSANQIHTHNALATNFSCMVCQRSFKSVRALTVHITKKHPEVEKHKCDRCKKAFVLHADLVEHLNRHKEYRNLTIEEYKSINRNDVHMCELCGKVFSQLCLLKRHSTVHSPTKPHECEICKYRFNNMTMLKAHLSNHTNESLRKFDSNPEDFKCPDCPRRFDKQLSLSMHRLTHSRNTSKANYSCAVCQRNFMSIKTLTKHLIHKHPEEKHKCDQCGKTFFLEAQLQAHLNHHKKHMILQSGECPYTCTQCGKQFRHSLNFKDHMRKHNGEKPFLCPKCGKTFCYSSNFRQHVKRHAGLKQYQCPLCPSRYMRRSDLLRHVQSARYHSKMEKLEKPHKVNGKIVDVYRVNDNDGEVESKNPRNQITFQCPECPKCFEKLTSLSVHYKIHTKKLERKKVDPAMQDVKKDNSVEKAQEKTNESKDQRTTIIVKEEIEIYEEPMAEFDEELDDNLEKEQFPKPEPKEIKNIDVTN